MGKSSRQDSGNREEKTNWTGSTKMPTLVDDKAVDPVLAALFASSAGPVKIPSKSRYEDAAPQPKGQILPSQSAEGSDEQEDASYADGDELSSVDEDIDDTHISDIADLSEEEEQTLSSDAGGEPNLDKIIEASTKKPERKRKRTGDEDLEEKYMQKLAKEEEKEEAERQAERRLKRQKLVPKQSQGEENTDEDVSVDGADSASNDDDDASEDNHGSEVRTAPTDIPLHESMAPDTATLELEKATRTVFLANVSTDAISSKGAKRDLLAHLSSFFPSLQPPPQGAPPHKLENIRFRSTAYAGGGIPKRAAFAKKELMPATTKSTNAYAVYSNAFCAREAVKRLNSTVVLDRHLRVDGVAHPAKTDHKRCVFVGNLGFVDDESMLPQEDGEGARKRSKVPSDVEEGLWRQFGQAGTVESVRVVRDEKTRVGKGFAYVQFEDANAVEAALLFNEKKYPPMLPRVLRVMRAKPVRKTANATQNLHANKSAKNRGKEQIYNPKVSSQASSLQGRAVKLLGKAGRAQFKKIKATGANGDVLGKRGDAPQRGERNANGIEGIKKTPESIVFEGYRASANAGKPRDLKLGGSGGKKKGKPRTRSSKRGADWKKSGGKKGK